MAKNNQNPEFIVIGLGRFGAALALALSRRGFSVLGVDHDPAIVQALSDRLAQVVSLDSTDEQALHAIDVASFDTAIVAIGSDFENNLMTLVALKSLGVRRVICKALTRRQQNILLRVGADRVILPEAEAGERLARELVVPNLVDQIPLGEQYSVVEIQVPGAMIGQSLRDVDFRNSYGVTVVAVKRGDHLTISPPSNMLFQAGDLVVVIGENKNLSALPSLK